MCISIPSKVVEIRDLIATVECYGVRREVSLLLHDDVVVGDYVLVQTGFVVEKVDEEARDEALRLFDEVVKLLNPSPLGK